MLWGPRQQLRRRIEERLKPHIVGAGIIRRIMCGQDPGSLASVANADAVEGLRARSGGAAEAGE